MRTLMRAVLGAAAIACGASAASGVEVYRLSNGVYERIEVEWLIPTDYAWLNPQHPGGAPGTVVTQNPVDPLDWEVKLANGDFGVPEGAFQQSAVWSAVAKLQPADGYVIVFDYDAFTWDSYNSAGGGTNPGEQGLIAQALGRQGLAMLSGGPAENVPGGGGGGCGRGYWDFVSVNINQEAPYYQLIDPAGGPYSDPLVTPDPNGVPVINFGDILPGVTWGWGGECWGDGFLENTHGRVAIELQGDPGTDYWVSISLDTLTSPTLDQLYPSWALFNNLRRCPADLNGDGVANGEDLAIFESLVEQGSLAADFSKNGVLDEEDIAIFQELLAQGCPERCRNDLNGDGVIDEQDLEIFYAAYEAGELLGDFNNDGQVDDADKELFVRLWEERFCVCVYDLEGDGDLDGDDEGTFNNAEATQSPYGDFNNDGVVDDTDRQILLEEIERQSCY